VRPIKFERRATLLKSIARGRAWLNEISSDSTTVEDIAARQKCSVRHVNMTISLAFIAPTLVKAAVEGRLPRGIGVAALRDPPAEWSLQFARLGLAPQRTTPRGINSWLPLEFDDLSMNQKSITFSTEIPSQVFEKMVGATGIEPVTPTMSR
jgi:hypothetical protein